MKHNIGLKVKVISATDDTCLPEYIGKIGTVTEWNANGSTGNTEKDPLHVVKFEGMKDETFWYEELQPSFIHPELEVDIASGFHGFYEKNTEDMNGFECKMQRIGSDGIHSEEWVLELTYNDGEELNDYRYDNKQDAEADAQQLAKMFPNQKTNAHV